MGNMLPEAVEKLVAEMSTEEKRSLAQALMRMVAAELAGGDADPERCPLCRCPEFVRKGHDRDGSQRWLCKGCGRTFGRKTMRVIAQSKLGEDTWVAYVYLSMRKSTLCYVDNRHFDSEHADRFTRGRSRHLAAAPAC